MTRCQVCGTTVGVQPYGLCRPCLHEAAAAQRAADGLPPRISDRAFLANVARSLRAHALNKKNAPAAAHGRGA